jgi:hypothetical protein
MKGSTSGTINITTQAASGTYNFNLPTSSGTSGQFLTSGGGGASAMTWTTAAITKTYWTITDQKTAGTNGGTSVANTWSVRTLNTITSSQTNTAVTLASNQITVTAGTYYFDIRVPGYTGNTGGHTARLYNVTTSAVALLGSACQNDISFSHSIIAGFITVASTTVFSVQHNFTVSTTNTGLGYATGLQAEVYTICTIVTV